MTSSLNRWIQLPSIVFFFFYLIKEMFCIATSQENKK